MRTGWWRFARKNAAREPASPDSAVAQANPWLLGALIIASTTALLGTTEATPDPVPTPLPGTQTAMTVYTFARTGLAGGNVDLTPAAPSATFFVNIRADALGPHDVVTTGSATAVIDAVMKSSGFAEGVAAPFVNFTLRSLGTNGQVQQQALDHFVQSTSLTFSGNCTQPTQGMSCSTSFALDISRLDGGADTGTVHVEWTFDLSSSAYGAADTGTDTNLGIGPLDPPWTVEVVQ